MTFIHLYNVISNYAKRRQYPEVVEKGIGILYSVGKPNKKRGRYTDRERARIECYFENAKILFK